MRVLLAYATTEGQTRKVARFVADHLIALGHSMEVIPAGEAAEDRLPPFDAAVLAGSIHIGRFQSGLEAFARTAAPALNARPCLFLAVSLSAAGDDPEDWAGLHRILARFQAGTGLHPGTVAHVAGAFRFSEYDFFRSWAMRWIAAQKGVAVDPHADLELTDWQALAQSVTDWAAAASAAG